MLTRMSMLPLEVWFRCARERWPAVDWSILRFGIHLGEITPKHPEDVFISGAASERLENAWVAINQDFRPEVLRRLLQVSRVGESAEDLWSETIVRLMSVDPTGVQLADGRPPCKIRLYRGEVPLPSYMAVIAKRIAFDDLRRRKVRLSLALSQAQESKRSDLPAEEIKMEQEMAERFATEFVDAFAALTPMSQALLSLHYGQGLAKADAGRLLGIAPYKVSRELGAAMKDLRIRLTRFNPETWSPTAMDMWLRTWMQCSNITGGVANHEP